MVWLCGPPCMAGEHICHQQLKERSLIAFLATGLDHGSGYENPKLA